MLKITQKLFTTNVYNKKQTEDKFKSSNIARQETFSSYNNSYSIAFLGKKDYTPNEKEFANYKQQLSKKSHKLNTNQEKADWDFYINSTDENMAKSDAAFKASLDFDADENIFNDLKRFDQNGVSDPKLKQPLDDLIKSYTKSVKYKADFEKLHEMEDSIAQKVNAYKGVVDGVEYPNAELNEMLKYEKNVEKRKQIYEALRITNSDAIAPDLIELAKARNELARKNGYEDYFAYMLKDDYELEERELFTLLDDLEKKTSDIYKLVSESENKKLADAFGIQTNELMPWHFRLQLEGSPMGEADKYITDNDVMQKTVFSFYKKMGWDVTKLPIHMDLFPKENKNQHGFCFDVDTNKDVRILANLRNDMDSVETLLHEVGHGVYDIGVSSKLAHFDRNPASSAATEAVAMMMESVPYREGFYQKELGMPQELVKKLSVMRLKSSIDFVKWATVLINFEKQLYANPEQDLPMLWYGLNQKHMLENIPSVLHHEWACVPHFLSHPVYYQNYLRAEIMASQMYDALHAKLGNLSENKDTAEYLRTKFFRFGASLKEGELLKRFTGSALSVDAYCKQFVDLAKHIL